MHFWNLLLPLVVVSSFQSMDFIPRIKGSDFHPDDDYYNTEVMESPLIVETGLDVESLCDDLMNKVENIPITLQQKTPEETKFYELTVKQAIDPIMVQSNHNKSLFAFCEGLLDEYIDNEDYTKLLTGKVMFEKDGIQREDWFDSFPLQFRPSDCVILAGEGATSTLHRDPFEWTGTSLCLEGTKLWRFIAPKYDTENTNMRKNKIDDLLQAYRLPSMAWIDDSDNKNEGVSLSAGWQSDFSLYDKRSSAVKSAASLANLQSEEERYKILESIASDPLLLRSKDDMILNDCSCWTVIQKPGDLLLIPAHWWHQTYALEPSLAIASQRCDSMRDAARVVEHILTTTDTMENAPELLFQKSFLKYTKKEEIAQVLDTLFDHLDRSL